MALRKSQPSLLLEAAEKMNGLTRPGKAFSRNEASPAPTPVASITTRSAAQRSASMRICPYRLECLTPTQLQRQTTR
jgi:hypothetical protein